jgi:hypothetical protein
VRRGPDVISSSYTAIERTTSFWKFSWKVAVRNQDRAPIRVRVDMAFKDSRGSVLDYGRETITINGNSVAEVTGVTQLKVEDAQRVTAAEPRVAVLAGR